MTSLLEGAKRLVSRGSDLGDRIEGLGQASRGCPRAPRRPRSSTTPRRPSTGSRPGSGSPPTTPSSRSAGATGSGKSSTFNALAGVELSSVGVRRPTTSWATACVWGKEGADELLDWLGIAPRHQIMRDSLLDLGKEDSALQGVVLLDLPDHDSTEVSHHLEVDRLIELADLMVWVLDPQKYADAAIHDRYLAPLATHQDVMLVVLNHIDEVPDRPARVDARRRTPAASTPTGSIGVPVLATSARTGEGIDELRDEIARRVQGQEGHPGAARGRRPQRRRAGCSEASGTSAHPELSKERIAALDDALADAAGVPDRRRGRRVGHPDARQPGDRLAGDLLAVAAAARPAQAAPPRPRQGRQAAHRPRPHVRAGRRPRCSGPASTARCAPSPTRSRRRSTRPWAESVRRASVSRLPDLNDRLDSALAATELDAGRIPVWAGLVRVLQWLLLLAALAGAVWLGVLATDRYLGVTEPSTPDVGGLPGADGAAPRRRRARDRAVAAVPAAGLGDRALAGRARPTGGCGRRSPRWPTSWSSRRCGPSWRRTTTVREGLGPAPSK